MTSDHNFYAGFAENMSVGGVFIATHQLKSVGDRIDFSLALPGSDEPFRGSGVVRWANFTEDIRVRAKAEEMLAVAKSLP